MMYVCKLLALLNSLLMCFYQVVLFITPSFYKSFIRFTLNNNYVQDSSNTRFWGGKFTMRWQCLLLFVCHMSFKLLITRFCSVLIYLYMLYILTNGVRLRSITNLKVTYFKMPDYQILFPTNIWERSSTSPGSAPLVPQPGKWDFHRPPLSWNYSPKATMTLKWIIPVVYCITLPLVKYKRLYRKAHKTEMHIPKISPKGNTHKNIAQVKKENSTRPPHLPSSSPQVIAPLPFQHNHYPNLF